MKRHSGEKNTKDHPLDVCDSSDTQGTVTRKATSKQRDFYGLEYMKVGVDQAATRITPADFKQKCSSDRVWIKHAYLQGTKSSENRQNDTDASDYTRRSKQTEPKRAGGLITKNLHSNQESQESFTAECFTTKPSVVCSSPKSRNKSLQQLQLSEFEVAELTERNVNERSVNERLSQKECCMVGIQTQSHIEMESAARNADDEGDVLAKVRVKPAGSQKEEIKALAISMKSTAPIRVTETGSTKSPRIEGLSVDSQGFQRKRGIFHKQVHHEYEDIDNILSGEYQSYRAEDQRTKLHSDDIIEESGEPELPERSYLEDIDFVVSEFDMILRRNPELPARAYLEDIDFICKEFNFFFRRKSRHQLKEEPKDSCRSTELDPEADGSNSDVTTEDDDSEDDNCAFLSEATVPCDHEPELPARAYLEDIDFICKEFNFFFRRKSRHQLKEEPKDSCRSTALDPEGDGSNSDATTEDDEDDEYAFLSEATVPCDHESPMVSSKQCSNPVVHINCPLLNVPHTSLSHGKASESQYQPLMSATGRMQDSSSCTRYDRVVLTSPRSPLQMQEAVESQKDQNSDNVTASSAVKIDESYYQPLLFKSHKDPEEDYCVPFTLSAEKSNSDKPYFIDKQQQRSLQFLPICTSFKTHENPSHWADSLSPGQTIIGTPITGDQSDGELELSVQR